jgi:Xaa-Pro aminopeptidase
MLLNWDRAVKKLDEYGLDAVIAAAPRNVYYASEYWTRMSEWFFEENFAAVLLTRDKKQATLLIPEWSIVALLEQPSWIPNIRPIEFLNMSYIANAPEPVRLDPLQSDAEKLYKERVVAPMAENVITATAQALQELKLDSGRIGFDDLRLAQHVQKLAPKMKIVDAHDYWLDVRKVKSADEQAILRHGAKINETALREITPLIKPGVVWREVIDRFRESVMRQDAVLLASQKGLQFGAEYGGEYFPDLMFRDNDWVIRDQQIIIYESWGAYQNYTFDCSRTVHVGKPSRAYADLCDRITDLQQEVEAMLRAGVSTHDVFKAGMKIVKQSGIETPDKLLIFMHSIGLDIIELPAGYPSFGQIKSFDLEPDMVLNFEFLYFGHTTGPFHIESSYLIREGGADCLHTLPKQLHVLPVQVEAGQGIGAEVA